MAVIENPLVVVPNGLDLSRLEPILLQTKLQSDNPPLYQTLLSMLRNIQAILKVLNGNIESVNNTVIAGAGITELTGEVTAGPGTGSQVATIPNDTVTYAKMQNISAASKLLGRGSAAGSGDTQEITLGTNLTMSGTTLNAADTDTGITQLTGDVTAGPGSGSQVATLANTAVTPGTYGDASNVAQFTVDSKGRLTAAANVAITASGGSDDFAFFMGS